MQYMLVFILALFSLVTGFGCMVNEPVASSINVEIKDHKYAPFTISMRPNYIGENVRYLKEEERGSYVMSRDSDGDHILVGGRKITDGSGKYVMLPSGVILMDIDGVDELPKHSSFAAGGDVVVAGHWKSDTSGKLIQLDTNSGHYQPPRSQLKYMYYELSERGFPIRPIYIADSEELIKRAGILHKHFVEHFADVAVSLNGCLSRGPDCSLGFILEDTFTADHQEAIESLLRENGIAFKTQRSNFMGFNRLDIDLSPPLITPEKLFCI